MRVRFDLSGALFLDDQPIGNKDRGHTALTRDDVQAAVYAVKERCIEAVEQYRALRKARSIRPSAEKTVDEILWILEQL